MATELYTVLSICFKRKKERWQISEERTKIFTMSNLNDEVSGIWNAFNRMSDESHRLWEIKDKKQKIQDSKTKCGSCYHWMTKQCRFESPRNKVTCGDRICDDFEMQNWVKDHIEKLEKEIVELENKVI